MRPNASSAVGWCAVPVPQPHAVDENMGAAVRLDRIAGMDVGDGVRPYELPIGPAGKDASRELWALDPPAQDIDDPSNAERRRAEMHDLGKLGMHREDRMLRQHRAFTWRP